MKEPWPAIEELSSALADFTPLLRYFANKFSPDGTLDDHASAELASLRREIESQRRKIQESLRGYLRRLSEGNTLQDELVTIRGDRFVIPVKTEQKRRVQGVVHGASSSGQTVFIEPLETIDQNNELVRLLEDEQQEIHRILLEMTAHIGQQSDAILCAVDVLRELELQFAKARFAEEYQCTRVQLLASEDETQGGPHLPAVGRYGEQETGAPGPAPSVGADLGKQNAAVLGVDHPTLLLLNARHPVLERNLRARGKPVVPLTLEMDAAHRQLIISGPNTGGKTVALKTVGLLVLMSQAGLPVPADRAALPICDAVLADIGDSQSIEQNLSTFSAHVTNIDSISHAATPHSLVLLDELGSATDPEEGAALAVAIADHFRRREALTLISTHHTALKIYATNSPGVLNAAVGFNEATLAPTYELRTGVPGASAGINIAQQIGLNREIIDEARRRLSTQTQDIAVFLDRLHAELRQLDAERLRVAQREQELTRERQRLETEGLREQLAFIQQLIEAVPQGQLDAVGALLLGEALYELGAFEEAHRVLARRQGFPASEQVALRLAATRAKNAHWGLCQPDMALAVNAAARAVVTSPPLVEELVADEASILMFSGHPDQALDILRTIDGSDRRTRVVRAIVAAVALATTGRTAQAVTVAEEGFADHLALGDELAIAHPATHIVNQVFALTEAGRLAEAEQLARTGAEVVASHRVPVAQIWFAANLGRVAVLQGRAATARRFYAEAAGLAEANHFAGPRRLALSGLALAHALLGDAEAAGEPLQARAALPEFGFLGPEQRLADAWAAVAARQRAAAAEIFLAAAELAASSGHRTCESWILHDLVRACAHAPSSRISQLAADCASPLVSHRARHAAALRTRYARELSGAADEFEALGADLLAAEAASAAADAFTRAGDPRAATAALHRCTVLAALCEGAATPGLVHAAGPVPLSDREREIAVLAAEGLASKDIADRLFLSVRTVNNHLQHAYTKLGVGSRTDLARALGNSS